MLKPNEIKSRIVLKGITQQQIASEIGIKRSQVSTIINNAYRVIYKIYEIIGENPLEINPNEIKSKMILKNVTQIKIANKIGITQSQMSTIINKGNPVCIRLSEIIGENPFKIDENTKIKNHEHRKNHRRNRNKKRIQA